VNRRLLAVLLISGLLLVAHAFCVHARGNNVHDRIYFCLDDQREYTRMHWVLAVNLGRFSRKKLYKNVLEYYSARAHWR